MDAVPVLITQGGSQLASPLSFQPTELLAVFSTALLEWSVMQPPSQLMRPPVLFVWLDAQGRTSWLHCEVLPAARQRQAE